MSFSGQQGFALIAALGFVVIVGLLVATALFVSTANERNAADALRTTQAQLAAEAGLEQAVNEVWYKVWGDEVPSTMKAYRAKADEVFPDSTSEHFPEDRAEFYTLSDNERYRVDITRDDDANPGIHFVVNATGRLTDGKTVRYLVQDFYVSPGIFQGFDFALLTNNANCVFCHTDIKSVDYFKTNNPNKDAPWNKARVGVLDTLQIRFGDDVPNNPDSKVAGAIYLRGDFEGSDGQSIGNTDIGQTTLSTSLDPGDEHIISSDYGSFSLTNCEVTADCTAHQSFYENYPDAAKVNTSIDDGGYGGKWPDGPLPDHFPLPIPDTDGNRIIDDGEWQKAVEKSLNGNDLDNPAGSITGPITINPDSVSGWPNATTKTLESGTCNGSQSDVCNVILDGHTTSLDIEGTVYINGDVIIRGKIKGSGKIIARGNVYVEGDLQYVCGANDRICTDQDWKDPSKLPKFALAAGGNMMIGDYETPWGADFTDANVLETGAPQCVEVKATDCGTDAKVSNASFSWREVTLFNRLELKKWLADPDYTPRLYAFRQNPLPACEEGDNIKASCDTDGYSNSIDFWNDPSTEGADAYGDPGYIRIPRDCLTDLSKCQQTDSGKCQQGETEIRISSTTSPTCMTATQVQGLLNKAAIYNLSPTDDWISETSLKKLWTEGFQNSRSQKPLRTDGMLYSANAIFELSRPPNEPAPSGAQAKTGGQWDLRGSLVAADTGILTPGPKPVGMTEEAYDNNSMVGLSLYHDDRLADFLKIRDNQDAKLFRSHWRVTTSDFQ